MATSPDKERRKQLRDAYKRAEREAGPKLTQIDYEQLEDLLDYVEEQFDEQPCDHSTRHAERWAESHHIQWAELAQELQEFGGYCDCEIVMNVEPEEVFG
ncbi:DUF2695 domain-containing protein [Mycobacterium angelicum]|uniref:DUF2695 domain-containing protein n=1 Tax=Mycobacterium angelicum TaxID=470074 RepID=A0A1W9ZJR4_MYCAN|nr:DUF2695 domain-containing protein [Mycobacterium angelicum]MCV7195916.1 DUF2695 domain-containing protein [Mycobacterium angelicum]ORA16953.1 hypothetical protein BST12_20260 [Mycobacterium angelicum]